MCGEIRILTLNIFFFLFLFYTECRLLLRCEIEPDLPKCVTQINTQEMYLATWIRLNMSLICGKRYDMVSEFNRRASSFWHTDLRSCPSANVFFDVKLSYYY